MVSRPRPAEVQDYYVIRILLLAIVGESGDRDRVCGKKSIAFVCICVSVCKQIGKKSKFVIAKSSQIC